MSDTTMDIRGYQLSEVLGRITPELRDEISAMWIAEAVLTAAEARRRADEVVIVARAPDGSLAGVNTAYLSAIPGSGARYWFYRTFVRPGHRGVWGVARNMLQMAIAALAGHAHPDAPAGVVVITENARLMRRGAAEVIEQSGMHRIGRDAQGRDVWCIRFDGAVPVAPAGLLAPNPPLH